MKKLKDEKIDIPEGLSKEEIYCQSSESPAGYHQYVRTGRTTFDEIESEFKCIYCKKTILL